MGLFDKGKRKRGDEFDSPVEKIDLSAAPAEPFTAARDESTADDAQAGAAVAAPTAAAAEPARERRPAAAARPAAPAAAPRRSGYGIDDAIALMRTLPSENVELVVQVVKHTLESTRIEIGSIIEDASEKQGRIESRIKFLRAEIADLEAEIAARRTEIENLDADHRETTMVKDRLQLAERLSGRGAAAEAAPRAARTTGDLPRPKTGTQPPPAASVTPAAPTAAATPGSGPLPSAGPSAAASPSSSSSGSPSTTGSTPALAAARPSNTVIVKK